MTFEEAIKEVLTKQAESKELFLIEELKPLFDYNEKTNVATLKEFMRLRLLEIEDYKAKVKEVIETINRRLKDVNISELNDSSLGMNMGGKSVLEELKEELGLK